METAVHAHVPNNADLTHNFFFDERYLLDCHQTTSKAKKATLPGSCYFKYLSAQEQIVQLLPGFVHKFTSKDLEEVTTKTAENIYIRLLKKASKKFEKLNIKLR